VDFYKQMYRYYHGSHKFKIYIDASIYHTVRLMFYIAELNGEDWEQCYHREVEVQGMTEVEIMMPYCSQGVTLYGTPPSASAPFKLCCTLVSWSQQSTTADTPIQLIVYKAACSDFQFGGPMDVAYTVTSKNVDYRDYNWDIEFHSNPRNDFNKDFEPMEGSMTGYSQTNMVFGEEIGSVRELVHRLYPIKDYSGGIGFVSLYNAAVSSGIVMHGIELLGATYRFWRGSVRVKLVPGVWSNDPIAMGFAWNSTTSSLYQGIVGNNATNYNVEGECPYYSNVTFEQTRQYQIQQNYVYSPSGNQVFLYKCGGDDFSYMWVQSPPIGTFAANPTGVGYLGALGNF